MRQHAPETLLLRIRAETLRLSLKRAHSPFKNLPSLTEQFKEFEERLSQMRECAVDLSEKVADLRQRIVRRVVPEIEAVKDVQDRLENMADGLAGARAKLTELGNKSFLIQMKEKGQGTWESLNERAGLLQADVEEIEKDLSGPNAWKALSKAEAEAIDLVFNECVELLGGMALRDAHLDADICDLAEALIQSIPVSGNHPNVIPGGISSMMMTVERFIRLRFPEWTIWGIPLAAHELWRGQFDNLLARSLGPDGSSLIKDPTIQQCLGDAFATYFMGPAYALAAVTLLFDPTRAQDDLRVRATESMLRCMDPTRPDAFSDSYQTVADNLASAWTAAKHQAGTTIDLSRAEVVETAVAALFKRLDSVGHPYFSVAEWKSVRNWAEKLGSDAAAETIEISGKQDLRHALNAVWLARLDAAGTKDISELAHRLVHRVKAVKPPKPSPEGPRVHDTRGLE
jgi:hypothetical protein